MAETVQTQMAGLLKKREALDASLKKLEQKEAQRVYKVAVKAGLPEIEVTDEQLAAGFAHAISLARAERGGEQRREGGSGDSPANE